MAVAFGVNVVLGGLVAGVLRGERDGDLWHAVVKGATGGAVSFAGKRLSVEPFFGAGLLGREVSAVGSSMVYNASTGSPAFSEVVLPLGPMRLHVLDRPNPFAIRLDVPGAVMVAYAVANPDLSFDLETSLSNGAPIFIDDGPGGSQRDAGKEIAGVLFVDRELWGQGTRARNRTVSHELVHAIQYDQSFITIGRRIQQLALTEPQGLVVGHLDWGFDLPFWWLGNLVVPYSERPWEREAKLLVAGK